MSNKKNKHDNQEGLRRDDDDDDSDADSDEQILMEKSIVADFEGRNAEDCDYNGLKQLLRQLFLKSAIDLGALAQTIISQNHVGSVIKQCLDNGLQDDDEDDEDDGSNGVFGITTVINITTRKNEPCIKQIRTLLISLAESNADDKTTALLKKILSDDSRHVGLVINERIINIPAAISVPMFGSLQRELEKAVQQNMAYTFQYLIWICKTYSTADETEELLFANQEEHALMDKALAHFEVDVSDQADLSQWDYEGGALTPSRKVIILDGTRFDNLVDGLKAEVQQA